jgi:hypothetical protein
VDIGRQKDVITDRARLQTPKLHGRGEGADEQARSFACETRRDEDEDLVDEAGTPPPAREAPP